MFNLIIGKKYRVKNDGGHFAGREFKFEFMGGPRFDVVVGISKETIGGKEYICISPERVEEWG